MTNIVNISLFSFFGFAIRRFHNQLSGSGVTPHSIFFKDIKYVYRTHARHFPITSKETDTLLGLIREIEPDLVTFSLIHPYAVTAREVIRDLRTVTGAPVMVGGIYPTLFPERALAFADFVCVGEGERVLDEVAVRLQDGGDLRGIRGLWHKDDAGRVVDMGRHDHLEELDELPFLGLGEPNMHFIEQDHLSHEDPLVTDPLIWVMTGRGCSFECAYCVNSLLGPQNRERGQFVRQQSPERIMRELHYQVEKRKVKAEWVVFYDELFGVRRGWTETFTEQYKKEVNLPFFCEIHPRLIQEENIRLLRDAGLTELNFGIQSGSERVRNEIMNRPGSNADLLQKVLMVHEMGIRIWYDLILENPFETVESYREAIRLMLQLPKPLFFQVFQLQYFPDYPMTRRALAAGHITEDDLTDENIARPIFSNNFFYTPTLFSLDLTDYLRSAIYLHTTNSRFSDLVCRKLLVKRSIFWGLLANLLARNAYHELFVRQPEIVRYFIKGVRLLFKGEWGLLAGKARAILKRFS